LSCACLHTSSFEPIIIRNILGDKKKNPRFSPEITSKRADGFPSSCRVKSFLQIHRNHRN
jgi:hypothetical protein